MLVQMIVNKAAACGSTLVKVPTTVRMDAASAMCFIVSSEPVMDAALSYGYGAGVSTTGTGSGTGGAENDPSSATSQPASTSSATGSNTRLG